MTPPYEWIFCFQKSILCFHTRPLENICDIAATVSCCVNILYHSSHPAVDMSSVTSPQLDMYTSAKRSSSFQFVMRFSVQVCLLSNTRWHTYTYTYLLSNAVLFLMCGSVVGGGGGVGGGAQEPQQRSSSVILVVGLTIGMLLVSAFIVGSIFILWRLLDIICCKCDVKVM